jgi:hypothetical protein
MGHTDEEGNDNRAWRYRTVTVPVEELELEAPGHCNLQAIFKNGQNDFSEGKPEHNSTYSVSAGDVIELDGQLWLARLFGFVLISEEQFQQNLERPHKDRVLKFDQEEDPCIP